MNINALLVRESDMKEFKVMDYRTSFTSFEITIKSADNEKDVIVERAHEVWVSIYETMGGKRNKYVLFGDGH